ncbi:MAG: 50S ribosomal protein L10 [Clostridiales bacterium]|nr:50S ribosomal protein L10 [Clostridiales bacterium]
MPSEKILQQKKEYVQELSGKLKNSVAGVVVSYQGLTVAEDTQLRRELRAAGVEYAVVKNTMLRRAAADASLEGLDHVLEGTTALAVSTDHIAAAKVLCAFAEKNKALEIKAGFVEGKVIDAAAVKELAKMPPKEVLVAKALGGLNAPISGFVCVLNANLRGLAVALNAIAEQKNA